MTFTGYVLIHARETDGPRGEFVRQVRMLICCGRFEEPRNLERLLDFARRRGASKEAARGVWRSYQGARRRDADRYTRAGLPTSRQTGSS